MLGHAMHHDHAHSHSGSPYAGADDLVSGEAVALELPAAGIGARMASGLLDVVVTVLAFVALTFVFSLAAVRTNAALLHVATVGALITALLVIPTTVETLTRGRSVGKWAMGLRVVRDDGGTISAQHAFTRALLAVVEVYALTGAGAFFSILLNSRGKRLGDLAAGTYVVRERSRLQLPPLQPMPPELAGWARSADIAVLPGPLALALRQFVTRSTHLTPPARAAVGHQLSEQVLEHVAPPPPYGTPPEAFLVAVSVARRERDLARMERERALRERLSSAGTPGR